MAYLGNVRGDNSNFCEEVENVVEPRWEKSPASLCEIESADSSKLDGKTLEEDGEDVCQEDDEQ